MSDSPVLRASLKVLRAEAADERAVLIQERLLAGEDPWAFMEELTTTDELTVSRETAVQAGSRPGSAPVEGAVPEEG